MRAELIVPNDWMTEYAQYDGKEIEAVMNPRGFAVDTIRIAHMKPVNWVEEPLEQTHPESKTLTFRLTHMRERDDTLVYKLIGWTR